MDLSAVGFAVESASAFLRTAFAVIPRAHGEEPPQNVGEGIPQLVSGAVNLSLAAELSLKSALICLGIKPKRTHNLADLYDQFPIQAQEVLTAEFETHLDGNPEAECVFHSITFSFGPDPQQLLQDEQARREAEQFETTLITTLRDHADTFQLWRYIHEVPESREAAYEYDFRRMVCATDVIWQFAVHLSKQRGLQLSINKGSPPDDWGFNGPAAG